MLVCENFLSKLYVETFLKRLVKNVKAMMKYLIFGFLNLVNAQDASQSYPDNVIPDNLGQISKIIDVTFTHNLPSSFNMREEDDYNWDYFDQGMVRKLCIFHVIWSNKSI